MGIIILTTLSHRYKTLDHYSLLSAQYKDTRHLRLAQRAYHPQGVKMTQQLISVDLIDKLKRSENKPESWTDSDYEMYLEKYKKFYVANVKMDISIKINLDKLRKGS